MTDYPVRLIPRAPSGILGPFNAGSSYGELAGSVGAASINGNPGGSQAYYIPVEVPNLITITQAIVRTGSVSSGNLDVALYDEQLNKLVGSGSTAMGGANSAQVFNLTDTPIPRGTYYCGFACDNGTANYLVLGTSLTGFDLQGCGIQVANAVYPLPNPATFPGGAPGAISVPIFGFAFTSTAL